MITVILYGRNDAYGYNLHKRAAISVNCIAAVLSDPDDEILFVDCNTPNELPTFIEAIYDTLTPQAKGRLRVLRVRPEIFRRLAGPTHLEALEPHARNIAIRRANPRNRWILLTNTDMIFLPRDGFRDLSSAVGGLSDGLYAAPRFELPEPLWESFPRAEPQAILDACRELGRQLHLEEVTLSLPEARFDQVGDFQLVPRQALYDIHGFDERMIYGWHCDSNLARRLYLYYGERTGSFADRVKGYHCDHTRVATGAHRLDGRVDNDVMEFVFKVDQPVAGHQAETWGAPHETIEEVDFLRDPQARYVAAVESTLGAPQQSEYESDAVGMRNFLSVQSEHVLPYLASDLTVYRRHARFAYVGNHARLLELAARCIGEMGFENLLEYAPALLRTGHPPVNARAIAAGDLAGELQKYDLVIFDFSLDARGLEGKPANRTTDWPRDLRYSLGAVARCLEGFAGRVGSDGGRVPDALAVNANHYTFRDFVNQFLLLTFTPFATHVRKGRPRMGEERRLHSDSWKKTQDLMVSFFGYDISDTSVPMVALDERIDFTSAGHAGRFKDGHWGLTDYTGTTTDGDRAVFLFQPPSAADDVIVSMRINQVFIGPEGDPIKIEVLLDGNRLAHWSFFSRHEPVDAKATLPAALLAGKSTCRLELHVENPQSVARAARARGEQVIDDDPRMLGCRLQYIVFRSRESLRYRAGETLEFTAGSAGAAHADECWSLPDNFGMWTFGPRSTLTLLPAQPLQNRAQAVFTINDVALSEAHRTQIVDVLLNGRKIATWTLGPARDAGDFRILLPEDALRTADPAVFSFETAAPRSPVQLGWSTWDTRPLGFRLARLRITPVGRFKYRLGDPIDFVDGGDSLVFVNDGVGREWSAPGARGSWTVGHRSSFRMVFEQPVAADLPCVFIISDCIVSRDAPKLLVTVKANGQPAAQWVLERRRPHRQFATVPAAAVAGATELTLTFEIAEPRSPQSLGWSADSRPLGFQLARAVIGSAEAEMPKIKAVGRERPMYQRILGLPQYAWHVARIVAKKYGRSE